jgi:hypothetical protein
MWTFEPKVAEAIFREMLKEAKVEIVFGERLDRAPGKGVQLDGKRITSITMESGKKYAGKMFMDATYEGDLMAAAGVSYTVGREPNSKYGETLNGLAVAWNKHNHRFTHKVDPYVKPGDPKSGLLPIIEPGPLPADGEGDDRLQAYCYRMCMSRIPANRVPFPRPADYDEKLYELLLRNFEAGDLRFPMKPDMMPNGKTDTNNNHAFSTDNIGMNYDYPEANYERRREICDEHRTYQQGYCYFLANDPRVPEDVREWYGAWGLCKDEFVDNGHWPHQIYVREARRMVGDTVVTQNHLTRDIPTPRPIGMGSYNMDSHNVQRYVDENGFARNEGDVQVNPGGPYPIDYGAIIPKKDECKNLLVVCAVSSTHIAYGSIRMEPVFMILGQSAASAADLAIGSGLAVQDIDYETLKSRLVEGGQVLAKPE